MASVVVVGDITEEELLPKLNFLNKWEGSDVYINKNLTFEEIDGKTILFDSQARTSQSIITLAHKGLKYDVDGDYYKANVMNFALGGAFSSRLNLNLREDKGYTYGIRSGFDGNDTDGLFALVPQFGQKQLIVLSQRYMQNLKIML